jgi:hypothetical protein
MNGGILRALSVANSIVENPSKAYIISQLSEKIYYYFFPQLGQSVYIIRSRVGISERSELMKGSS